MRRPTLWWSVCPGCHVTVSLLTGEQCLGCHRPQYPEQWGPSEEDLVNIEAQRKRDRLKKRADNHQKALQRARGTRKVNRELETRPKSQKKDIKPARPFKVSVRGKSSSSIAH